MESPQKENVSVEKSTISMSLASGRENSLPIPIELIIFIFSKLDLKSIARSRCVSKLWGSILRLSDFTELVLNRGPNLLFAFSNESKLFFSLPHPQNPDMKSSSAVINHQMTFSVGFISEYKNSDLVHGLICLNNGWLGNGNGNREEGTETVICNPSTGQTLVLPELNTNGYFMWRFLGYDPIDKQFKVLAITSSGEHNSMWDEFQVLTLESGNMSWRKIDCLPQDPPHGKICVNGHLYYTSFNWCTMTCKVVCFDIRFEKFSSIELMGTLKEAVLAKTINLVNYHGKLGLLQCCEGDAKSIVFNGISISFKLWVLENLEKQEWSEHTFVFSTVPNNIVEDYLLRFVGVTKKMEIVLSSDADGNYPFYNLFYLDLERNSIATVQIQVTNASKCGIFLDHVENVNFYASV